MISWLMTSTSTQSNQEPYGMTSRSTSKSMSWPRNGLWPKTRMNLMISWMMMNKRAKLRVSTSDSLSNQMKSTELRSVTKLRVSIPKRLSRWSSSRRTNQLPEYRSKPPRATSSIGKHHSPTRKPASKSNGLATEPSSNSRMLKLLSLNEWMNGQISK